MRLFAVCHHLVVSLLLSVVTLLAVPHAAAAQVMRPLCVEGCLPDYAVSVTPDGTDTPDRAATSGGYYATFYVHNTGQLSDTYTLSCSVTGPVTCDHVSPTSLTVGAGSTKSAKAWYAVGNPGTGTIRLDATGEASDDGYYDVHVVTPPASPIVLLTPWNGAVRDLSACVNACFEKVVTHATPAYTSLDLPRSFGLTYASGSARPTPVVVVDAIRATTSTTRLSIQLQRVSNSVNLTLLNGATEAWYAASGDTVRLAAAFDARANGFTASGVYRLRVTVTARSVSDSLGSTTLTTTVPIVVRADSTFGQGIWPTGLPRLVSNTDAGGSALIQSDGSLFYYGAGHPGGITASLSGSTLTALDGATVSFNAAGLPTAAADRHGNATHYYWNVSQLDSIVDPMGKKLTLGYTSGKLATVTDPGGRVAHYTINASNQLVAIQNPDTVSTQFGYDTLGLLTSVTGRNGSVWTTVYDELRRVKADSAPAVLLSDGTTRRPTVTYLAAERVVWQPQTAGTSAVTGNVRDTYDALGHRTRRHFDALGRTDSVYAANGAVSGTSYGILNQVLAVKNPLGYVTQTRYNPDLTVQRILDAKNQVYKFTYNVLGWPTARFDLADTTKADSMWYDAAGQVKRTKTRRGNTLQALYDNTGRLTELMYRRPGATVDTAYAIFTYDTVGKRVRGWNWTQTDSLVYNGLGQLTGHWMQQGTETYQWAYQYDDQDRLTVRSLYRNGVSLTAGSLLRGFDTYGQLTSTSAAGVTVRFDRTTADSLPTKRVINPGSPGSWWMSTVLDSMHQPVRDSLSIAALDGRYGKVIQRDPLGRLTAIAPYNWQQQAFRYDLGGQLRQACAKDILLHCYGESGTTELNQDAYTYDATGNRTDTAATATTVIGAGNRVTQFKGYTLSYDPDGNIVSKSGNGEAWTYTWDPFDKLTDVTLNGTLVYHFGYDAFGNRVARCTDAGCSAGEREVNDGSQFVLARNGSGTVTDAYGYYPGGDQPMSLQLPSGRTGVFITDPQLRGTVRAIADADKNATNVEFKSYDISPWGEVAADTGSVTRLRLAGQPYDQGSALYYMRARYYDPALGGSSRRTRSGSAAG